MGDTNIYINDVDAFCSSWEYHIKLLGKNSQRILENGFTFDLKTLDDHLIDCTASIQTYDKRLQLMVTDALTTYFDTTNGEVYTNTFNYQLRLSIMQEGCPVAYCNGKLSKLKSF